MTDANLQRMIELERADAAHRALQDAANALECLAGNELYQRAWRHAADFLRAFKPGVKNDEKSLNDKSRKVGDVHGQR